MDNNQIVLVEDPEALYSEARHIHADSMLYGRKQITGTSSPYALRLGASRVQWEAFEPQFAAALPVLEAYSQSIRANSGQPLWALSTRPNRVPEIEPEEVVRRAHFEYAFRFIVTVSGQNPQFMGVLEEFPDLCDHPWLEWEHPPQDFTAAFLPFRQYAQAQPPWQWQQIYWQSPNWWPERFEAETDTVNREFQVEDWMNVVRQVYPVPTSGNFPAVQLELFQIEPTLGSITLIWSASPGAAGYRLYINGVPQPTVMPFGQQTLTITNLVLGQAYLYGIVAVNGFGIDSSSLSNVILYEHNDSEIMAVENLSSDNPGSGL